MTDMLYLMGFKDAPPVGAIREFNPENQLHLTILNNFHLPNEKLDEVRGLFDRAMPHFGKIMLKELEYDNFTSEVKGTGEVRTIPVLKVDGIDSNGNNIKSFHSTLASIVLEAGGCFHNTSYILENYTPHISHAKGLDAFQYVKSLSLIHHSGGFGVGVTNLYNYFLQ